MDETLGTFSHFLWRERCIFTKPPKRSRFFKAKKQHISILPGSPRCTIFFLKGRLKETRTLCQKGLLYHPKKGWLPGCFPSFLNARESGLAPKRLSTVKVKLRGGHQFEPGLLRKCPLGIHTQQGIATGWCIYIVESHSSLSLYWRVSNLWPMVVFRPNKQNIATEVWESVVLIFMQLDKLWRFGRFLAGLSMFEHVRIIQRNQEE